jgi:hypothetical protein
MRIFYGFLCLFLFTNSAQTSDLELRLLGTYETGVFDEGAAEISAYDPSSKKLFVINAQAATVDILDLSNPSRPQKIGTLNTSSFGAGVNSVAVHNGIIAVAVEASPKQNPGRIVFFNANGTVLKDVPAGALPDMVAFTPDGRYLLAANEGEPSDDYTNDPEGSITIVNLSNGVGSATTATATFTAFNSQATTLRAQGLRIFGPNASVAQDIEPEYIAISADSRTAYVSLQENNALAIVNIANASITAIKPLGTKDHTLIYNAIDASDRDGGMNMQTWPIRGYYMPDAIASFEINGKTYIASANEGDSRDYGGYSEETRVGDLTLDPTAFPNAATLQNNANLGRLKTTTAQGDTDGDGDHDIIYSYGGRSFSIWDDQGNLVFDSANDFERITARQVPSLFNSQGASDSFDSRSDDKGPEPEAITTGRIGERTYAFIGMERVGGIFAYDITVPQAAQYVTYTHNPKDIGPEGILFVPSTQSPNQKDIVIVSSEVSGTVSVYQVINNRRPNQTTTLTARVTQNGNALSNVRVEFAKSIAGLRAPFEWTGTTNSNGQTTITINTPNLAGYYLARAINASGVVIGQWHSLPLNAGATTSITLPIGAPASFNALTASNFPNPFNPETVISYNLPQNDQVSLIIYNTLGQNVRTLVNTQQQAGAYRIRWNGQDNAGHAVASGRYLYQLITSQDIVSGHMMLLK